MSGCSYTGPGWYRMRWRGARDVPGKSKVVWIQGTTDPDLPDFLSIWPDDRAVKNRKRLMMNLRRDVCEEKLIGRVEVALM